MSGFPTVSLRQFKSARQPTVVWSVFQRARLADLAHGGGLSFFLVLWRRFSRCRSFLTSLCFIVHILVLSGSLCSLSLFSRSCSRRQHAGGGPGRVPSTSLPDTLHMTAAM